MMHFLAMDTDLNTAALILAFPVFNESIFLHKCSGTIKQTAK